MTDKPMYDRYAPHEQATIAALTPIEVHDSEGESTEIPMNAEGSSENAETAGDSPDGETRSTEAPADELEDLDKEELIEVARRRGVASYGTKRDIIDRLRSK
jgi:hypothetical protein